nr:HAD family hydrolase [Mycoplasma sp. Ms02]
MDKKIFFIDLDGTFLDIKEKGGHGYSERNLQAVQKIRGKHEVVFSTGRGITKWTMKLMQDLGFSNFILWNGAKIFIDNKEVFSSNIDESIKQGLLDYLLNQRVSLTLNSDLHHLTFTKSLFHRLLTKLTKRVSLRKTNKLVLDQDLFKIMLYSLNPRKMRRIKKHLDKHYSEHLTASFTGKGNYFMEITSSLASKGKSEEWYLNHFGYKKENAYHIGDSMNDSTSKGKVGTLVAVKNASPQLIAIADLVLDWDHDQQAVAKFLEQFLEN